MTDRMDILTDAHLENLGGPLTADERSLLNALWQAYNRHNGTDTDVWMTWYPEEWFAAAGVPYDGSALLVTGMIESLMSVGYVYEIAEGCRRGEGWFRVISEWSWQMNDNDRVEEFSVRFGDSFQEFMRDGLDRLHASMMAETGGGQGGAAPPTHE